MPRGEVDAGVAGAIATARNEAEMRIANVGRGALHTSAGSRWTVVVEPDAESRPSPLHRFARIHAVRNRAALLGAVAPLRGRLSTVGVAGLTDAPDSPLTRALGLLGASRLCAPGRMQAPPLGWHHDGMPLLAPLVAFTDVAEGPA
jgi:hypothetical protein